MRELTKISLSRLASKSGRVNPQIIEYEKIYEPSLRAQQLAPACPAFAGIYWGS